MVVIEALFFIICIAAVLFIIDRILLKAEEKGWIYWRKSKPNSRSVGTAFMELQSHLDPSKQHVIEAMEEVDEEEAQGDPPDPANQRNGEEE